MVTGSLQRMNSPKCWTKIIEKEDIGMYRHPHQDNPLFDISTDFLFIGFSSLSQNWINKTSEYTLPWEIFEKKIDDVQRSPVCQYYNTGLGIIEYILYSSYSSSSDVFPWYLRLSADMTTVSQSVWVVSSAAWCTANQNIQIHVISVRHLNL